MGVSRHARAVLLNGCAIISSCIATGAHAADDRPQETGTGQTTGSRPNTSTQSTTSDALMGDIVVTATKKASGEALQQVAISAVALGSAQLEALQFKNLSSIAFSAPNVQLDAVGTQKGIANFTIRGVSVNSSVPSVEPTVGTFIDGVYLGTNFGVILDTFDIESVEVLRGPQGVLFGRNVTGGAVSIRTRRPDGEFRVKGKASIESGLIGTGATAVLASSVEGTIAPDLFGKITGYYSHDGGFFKNPTLGRDVGKDKTWFVRPTLVLKPSGGFDLTLIGEIGRSTGDGAVAHNPGGLVNANKFTTESEDMGFNNLFHANVTAEANIDLGSGVLTDVAGWRKIKQSSQYDPDGSALAVYDIGYFTKQSQFSNELRYAVNAWDKVDIVTGVYFFSQDIFALERDDLRYLGRFRDYGGRQRETVWGAFANFDIALTEALTLGVGGRYSIDRKRVNVSNAVLTPAPQPCDFDARTCATYAFNDRKTFRSFTPKASVKYQIAERSQAYASFARGYRSGGYNIRNSAVAPPGPFGDELADSWEVGVKSDLFDRTLRINLAAFRNTIHDIQRQAATVTPSGQQVIIDNAGTARLQGFEGEISVRLAQGLLLRGTVGYTHGRYTKVEKDINGDRVIDGRDSALKIPRLAPWTYGASIFYDSDVEGLGKLSTQVQFNHRDGSFFTDANAPGTYMPAVDDLFASLAVRPTGMEQLRVSIYGKNLLNNQALGLSQTLASLPSGGAVQIPNKGRIFGLEVAFDF